MITSTLYVHVNKYSPHLKVVISVRYSCAVHSCNNTTLFLQNAITMSLYRDMQKSNTSPTLLEAECVGRQPVCSPMEVKES